jgi:hypothetical protein
MLDSILCLLRDMDLVISGLSLAHGPKFTFGLIYLAVSLHYSLHKT